MGYLVNLRFVERLSNDPVRRQYIVEVCAKWRFGRPFGFDALVDTLQAVINLKRFNRCLN